MRFSRAVVSSSVYTSLARLGQAEQDGVKLRQKESEDDKHGEKESIASSSSPSS